MDKEMIKNVMCAYTHMHAHTQVILERKIIR